MAKSGYQSLESGKRKIDWVKNMPVLSSIEKFIEEKPFKGLR